MSLDSVEAIKDGLRCLTTRNATILISLYFTIGLLRESMTQTLISKLPTVFSSANINNVVLVLPVPAYIAGLLLVPLIAASAALGVTALRIFASGETEKIKEKFYREHIGKASLNLIGGGIANGLLIILAFLIPVLPGAAIAATVNTVIGGILAVIGLLVGFLLFLVVMVKLYLWTAIIAVENVNFIEAFKSSWNMTKGESLRIGLVLLFLVIFSIIVNGVFSIPQLMGYSVGGRIIAVFGTAVTSTATVAIVANVYNQLK